MYMRMRTASVLRASPTVIMTILAVRSLGELIRFGVVPAGGLPAGPFSGNCSSAAVAESIGIVDFSSLLDSIRNRIRLFEP